MADTLIKSRSRRMGVDKAFIGVAIFAASLSMLALGILLWSIVTQGWAGLNGTLLTGVPSRKPEESGIWPAMWGTICICLICGLSAVPIGVGTAIFLEEFKPRSKWMKKAHAFIQLNIANLAGVPSVVYGILGLTVFVGAFGLDFFGTPAEPRFTIGLHHHSEIIDEAGSYLLYPADEPEEVVDPESGEVVKEFDLTTPEAGQTWETYEGAAYTLKVLPRAEVNALNKQVNAATDKIETEYEAKRAAFFAAAGVEEGDDDKLTVGQRKELEALDLAESQAVTKATVAKLGGVLVEGSIPEPVDSTTRSWYYLQIPLGRSVMAGGLTLMLVVLPVVIISAQEALRAVPDSLRQGCLALGCTRWQTVWKMSLPSALPGIMTGTILAMSRAIGEAAPILIIAGVVFITFTPEHLMDQFTAMPLQIYNWAARPDVEFHHVAASGIILLLAILLSFNALAVFIRYKFQKPLS